MMAKQRPWPRGWRAGLHAALEAAHGHAQPQRHDHGQEGSWRPDGADRLFGSKPDLPATCGTPVAPKATGAVVSYEAQPGGVQRVELMPASMAAVIWLKCRNRRYLQGRRASEGKAMNSA